MLLIDGDVLVYRFAHGEQKTTRWHRDLYTTHALLEPACLHIEDFIAEIKEATGQTEIQIVLSDLERNFRNEELPRVSYKASRAGVIRPLLWKPLRLWMEAELGAVWAPRLEGDDLLGLLAEPGVDVIATIDKDLTTVPGLHYNWDRADEGVLSVTAQEAERFFLTQVLTGDKTDGYCGVPGVGPVKAARILDSVFAERDPWQTVVDTFTKAGLSADVALDTARCAWILRKGDYDFDTGEITMWTPDRLLT